MWAPTQEVEGKREAVPLGLNSFWQCLQAILGGVGLLMKKTSGNHMGVVRSESTRRPRWISLSPCTLGHVGSMPSESDLAPVSLGRTASRWVSGNLKPLLKRLKSIAPPGMGLGLTQVSAPGLQGLRQKVGQKTNLRPCMRREWVEIQRMSAWEMTVSRRLLMGLCPRSSVHKPE